MTYTILTKFEIAEEQLFQSIALYLEGKKLISSITLAGAAEEILGKLVKIKNKENALELKVKDLCQLEETLFSEKSDPKKYIKIRNEARNELKHMDSENKLNLDIEQEAVNLLRRAIKNHKILKPGFVKLIHEFEKESIRRWRKLTGEIT